MISKKKPAAGGKNLQYRMRQIHRVLGYLVVGLVVVYALSGIVLIHRTGDMMMHPLAKELTLAPGLTPDALGRELHIRGFKAIAETDDTITFAEGTYSKSSGVASYTTKEYIAPMGSFVELHRLPDARNRHIAWVTTLFGVVLLLLALTSLFMYKPKSKTFKANMLYTAMGVALAILLLLAL